MMVMNELFELDLLLRIIGVLHFNLSFASQTVTWIVLIFGLDRVTDLNRIISLDRILGFDIILGLDFWS